MFKLILYQIYDDISFVYTDCKCLMSAPVKRVELQTSYQISNDRPQINKLVSMISRGTFITRTKLQSFSKTNTFFSTHAKTVKIFFTNSACWKTFSKSFISVSVYWVDQIPECRKKQIFKIVHLCVHLFECTRTQQQQRTTTRNRGMEWKTFFGQMSVRIEY